MTLEQIAELRVEFERQHAGRNLGRHHLRGTYITAPIAALWNQHLRSVEWALKNVPVPKLAAWCHPTKPYVIHADVRALWMKVTPNEVEDYSVPLYDLRVFK